MVWEIEMGKWWLCIGKYWINNPTLLRSRPVTAQRAPLMKVFSVITGKLWTLSEMRMKYASAAVRADSTNSDSCHCSLLLPPSIVSGVLSGCHLYRFEPVRQQNAEPSFAETKMSEQHFRRVAEPELSRFHSLSFKRLQLLTKFSATGNCSVPSSFSLPVSRSAACSRLAFLVMLRILCRLFPVSEGFVIAVNWSRLPVCGVCVCCCSKCNSPRLEKYSPHDSIVAQAGTTSALQLLLGETGC